MLLWGDSDDSESGKAKNVRQTELLVDLREAILQVARHFQSIDPKNAKVVSCYILPFCFCFWEVKFFCEFYGIFKYLYYFHIVNNQSWL